MLPRCRERRKRAQIPSLSSLGIYLSRVKSKLARFKFANHDIEDARSRMQVGGCIFLRHKIFCCRMVHYNRRRTLLRFQQESCSQAHADVFFGMEQRKQFCLIFQVRARGVAEAEARTAILLMKEIADVRRVVACCAQPAASTCGHIQPELRRFPR